MRSAAEWVRIRQSGEVYKEGTEELRIRRLSDVDLILEVQKDALSSSAQAIEQLHKEGKLFTRTFDNHDGFGPEPI